MKNKAQSTAGAQSARSVVLFLASILIALAGSFLSGVTAALLSVAGYAVGLAGALRESTRERAYVLTAGAFLLGLALTCLREAGLLRLLAAYGVGMEALNLLWFAASAAVTLLIFATVYRAIGKQLKQAGASAEFHIMGRRWVKWTALALALNLLWSYGTKYITFTGQWWASIEITVIAVTFALMVSAVVMGVRYLLRARWFFLSQSSGTT